MLFLFQTFSLGKHLNKNQPLFFSSFIPPESQIIMALKKPQNKEQIKPQNKEQIKPQNKET